MKGVIAAGNTQTVAAGAAMLRQGGNAVDAAVAAAFVSFVCETGVVHLGGSGIAQLFDPHSGTSLVYDFFSAMPGLGSERTPAEIDFEQVTIDYGATTQNFHLGRGAVAVPGNIFGLTALARDHGRLPLATLLQPAIDLARDGAVLDQFQADTCELLRPIYTHSAGMRHIFAPHGEMVHAGSSVHIPDLADTLEQLAVAGDRLLRDGPLARAFVTDQEAHGGLVTATDLAHYKVHKVAPIELRYRDVVVLLPPPCSTGGVLTAFTLKLLSHFPMGQADHGSAKHLRLLYEALAATTRARPFWEKASQERDADDAVAFFLDEAFVGPFVAEMRAAVAGATPSTAAVEPPGPSSTSHLSVIDANGMAVSLTTTAGETAGYVVPGTGFIPNNILGEEDLNPGGFHLWRAGQRIPTMMTPMIVLRDGQIRLVSGSGGSNRIRSAILQTLVNVLDYELPLADAVNRARIHVEERILQCEHGYDPQAVATLEAQGYPINRWPVRSIYFGGAHSVARAADGTLTAAGDNRRGGATGFI